MVGVVGGPLGLRGEVRVRLETDFPEQLADKGEIQLRSPDGETSARRIAGLRLIPGREVAVVKFEGCETREDAMALRGSELRIDRSRRAKLPEGSYYIQDLVGLEVLTTDGRSLGKIKEVLQMPANDVYVTETVLIPALKSVVQEIDIPGGKMTIRPVEGLLD